MSRRIAVVVLVLCWVQCVPGFAFARAQVEPTFVVTSAGDSGPGTLRQAILDANAVDGLHATITFDLAGAPPYRIAPVTALPAVTVPVTIDGTTQPGYSGTPVVELRGSASVNVGLELGGGQSRLLALVVNGFADTGIRLREGGNAVEGCYVGTDISGTVAVPNVVAGIDTSGGDRIGGTEPGAGNLISGNGSGSSRGGGIYVRGANSHIEGNAIGTDVTRSGPLGNSGPGIRTYLASVVVGGMDRASANIIAFNDGPGVMTYGSRTSVLGNSIYANGARFVVNRNGQYGIHSDVALPPWPTLVYVSEGATTRVKGAILYSRDGVWGFGTIRFELFRNVECAENGFGQGKEFLGAAEGTRGLDGLVTFEIDVPIQLGPGETLTCTATSPIGATSAFSTCSTDTAGCELPFETDNDETVQIVSGDDATLESHVTGSGPFSYQWAVDSEEGGFVPVPGATGAAYTARGLTKPTRFSITVSNACGTSEGYFTVAACSQPPSILVQPEDVTVIRGNAAALQVASPDGGNAAYHWYRGRRGDVSRPDRSMYANLAYFVLTQPTESDRYWCRVSNACGSANSDDALVTVVEPIEITSVQVKGSGAKAKVIVRGTSIPSDVHVYVVEGTRFIGFDDDPKVKGGKKITQRGATRDGRTIDEVIPPSRTTTLAFYSSHGNVTYEYTRP